MRVCNSGIPRFHFATRLLGIDQRGALVRILLRQNAGHWRGRELRIGHIALQVAKSQLLGFNLNMQHLHARLFIRPDLEILQDVEHFKRPDSLPVGWQLGDLPAAIIGRDRLHPFGVICAKIGARYGSTERARSLEQRFTHRTIVESPRAQFGDQTKRVAKLWIAEDFAGPRSASIRQI